MTSNLPAWTALDAGALPLPSGAPGGPGRVVAILATDSAIEAGWAGACAVDLARAWASTGNRVVLADTNLSAPSLHEDLRLPNGEGLTDILLWGASVRRVAHGIGEEGFYLVTAGTAVADPATALRSARWGALCDGFRDAGVTLAVFLPYDAPTRDAILGRASEVVIVAPEAEELSGVADAVALPVVGVVGRLGDAASAQGIEVPEAPEAPEAPTVEEAASLDETRTSAYELEPLTHVERGEPSEDVAGWGSLDPFGEGLSPEPEVVADAASEPDAPEEATSAPEDAEGAEDAEDAEGAEEAGMVDPLAHVEPLPAFTRREEDHADESAPRVPPLEEVLEDAGTPIVRPAGRRRALLVVLLLLVVVMGLVGAALMGYVHIPGVPVLVGASGSSSGGVMAAEPAEVPAPAPAVPTATTPPAMFDVALGAYRDATVAAGRVSRLGAAVPGIVLMSVPVEVDGVLYHRVLAGPAADSAAAAALAGRIAEATGLSPSGWVIRTTPCAFLLGEMARRAAADQRAGELKAMDVPAYVLAVDYTDGSTRYRVYAGAFADENEASSLSAQLEKRGLDGATLSDRIGRLPE